MIAGLNVDPAHFEDYDALARDLRAAGATVARFPLVRGSGVGYMSLCGALIAAGVEPLPVFARESFTPELRPASSIAGWADQLPGVKKAQVGNESDHHSPSSWDMEPGQLSGLLQVARAVLSDWYLIAGGMVSGHPEYLDGVDLSPVDALAVHPYGQRVNGLPREGWGFGELFDLIEKYKRFGKPIWITECGGPIRDFRSQEERATYYGELVTAANASGCAAVLPFKYEDLGVEGFGMQGTPALEAFRQAATQLDQFDKLPTNSGGTVKGNMTPTERRASIDAKVNALKDAGVAVGSIYKYATKAGSTWAFTDAGVIIAEPGVPGAYLLKDFP